VAVDDSVAGAARSAWMATEPCFRHGTYYNFERRVGATTYAFLVRDNGPRTGSWTGWTG
jgi:hypothetical protein